MSKKKPFFDNYYHNPTEQKVYNSAEKNLIKYKDILDNARLGIIKPRDKYEYIGDYVDLIRYYEAVLRDDFKIAYNIQEDLDTDCRDKIPLHIYNFIVTKHGL